MVAAKVTPRGAMAGSANLPASPAADSGSNADPDEKAPIASSDANVAPFLIALGGTGLFIDPSLNPNASGSVIFLAMQGDGKILIGGNFNEVGGEMRSLIARLHVESP